MNKILIFKKTKHMCLKYTCQNHLAHLAFPLLVNILLSFVRSFSSQTCWISFSRLLGDVLKWLVIVQGNYLFYGTHIFQPINLLGSYQVISLKSLMRKTGYIVFCVDTSWTSVVVLAEGDPSRHSCMNLLTISTEPPKHTL